MVQWLERGTHDRSMAITIMLVLLFPLLLGLVGQMSTGAEDPAGPGTIPERATALALDPDVSAHILGTSVKDLMVIDRADMELIVGGHSMKDEEPLEHVKNIRSGWVNSEPIGDDGYYFGLDAGDVDGDGNTDIVAARYWEQPDLLFRGDGYGSFMDTPAWSSANSYYSRAVALGDYDRDGDLDLAVATWRNGTHVYENVNGTLSPEPIFNSTDSDDSYDIAWIDVDSDLYPELLVANNVGSPDRLYDNMHGRLCNVSEWNTTSNGYSRSIGLLDPDNDGDTDVFIADGKGANRMYMNNNGSLENEASWNSVEWDRSNDCVVVDIDGDGRDDIAVANLNGPDRVYLNHGESILEEAEWSSLARTDSSAVDWYTGNRGPTLIFGSTNGTLAIYEQRFDIALFSDQIRVEPERTVLNSTVRVDVNITIYGPQGRNYVPVKIMEIPNIHGYPLYERTDRVNFHGNDGEENLRVPYSFDWFSGDMVGTHSFMFIVDPEHILEESNEHNNIITFNITVKAWNVKIAQVETTEFPNVTSYFSVTDQDGRPVFGLEQEFFNVTENGVGANITDFIPAGNASTPVNVILTVDCSGSMTGSKLDDARYASKLFVNHMQINDSVAVIKFDDEVSLVSDFSSNKLHLKKSIDGIRGGGGTNLYDALYLSVDALAGMEGVRAVILLTDGRGNSGKYNLNDGLDRALELGVPVYTIGLGNDVFDDELRTIATTTGGNYFMAPSPEELAELYALISEQLQNLYQITHESPVPVKDGSVREVTLFLDHDNATGNDSISYQSDRSSEPIAHILDQPRKEDQLVGGCWVAFFVLAVLVLILTLLLVVTVMVRKRIKRHKVLREKKERKRFERKVREIEAEVLTIVTDDTPTSTVEMLVHENTKDAMGMRAWFTGYPDLPDSSKVAISSIKAALIETIVKENSGRKDRKWKRSALELDRPLERLYEQDLEKLWGDDRDDTEEDYPPEIW